MMIIKSSAIRTIFAAAIITSQIVKIIIENEIKSNKHAGTHNVIQNKTHRIRINKTELKKKKMHKTCKILANN